jgi:hypothetical protein
MRFYTIHAPTRPWASRQAVIADTRAVKDGFSWPAFIFSFVWALWHRLWLIAAAIIGFEFAAGLAIEASGVGIVTQTAASLAVALVVGWVANDFVRRDLERRGLAEQGVVMAGSAEEAVARYYAETAR